MTRFAESRTTGGTVREAQGSVLDHDYPAHSDLLAVNRFGTTARGHALPCRDWSLASDRHLF